MLQNQTTSSQFGVGVTKSQFTSMWKTFKLGLVSNTSKLKIQSSKMLEAPSCL